MCPDWNFHGLCMQPESEEIIANTNQGGGPGGSVSGLSSPGEPFDVAEDLSCYRQHRRESWRRSSQNYRLRIAEKTNILHQVTLL